MNRIRKPKTDRKFTFNEPVISRKPLPLEYLDGIDPSPVVMYYRDMNMTIRMVDRQLIFVKGIEYINYLS